MKWWDLYSRLRNIWWGRQRKLDLLILWPICKEQAPSLDIAQQAFMVHAIQEPCWVCHYKEELWNVIRELK